ncbi:MAG: hypothetical protein R3264_07450, partial [Anaerolineae bacterium]|nr:hypothetical protein [Anaerolineae bacterium]
TVFQVNPVPPTVTEIVNQATFGNVQNDVGLTRIVCLAEATLAIVAPTPTPTPTSPSSPPKETPPPTVPPATATLVPPGTLTLTPLALITPSPPITPGVTLTTTAGISPTGTVLPVNLLPETGDGRLPANPSLWPLLALLGLGMYFLWRC